jgi:DNA-directed RNA polymerase subunit M/transcription elongation factor TFIIS
VINLKRCIYCGRENKDSYQYCAYCGEELSTNVYGDSKDDVFEQEEKKQNNNQVTCPRCGSTEIYFMTREKGGFDASNACCGYIILGPLGLLCGLASDRESVTMRKCKNCGNEF